MSAHSALIIDDSAVARKIILSLLAVRHIRTDYVDSGSAALEYLQQQAPDVVFLDLELGDLHGLQVLEKARNRAAGALPPFVICTGNQYDRSEFAHCEEIVEVLVKPYSEAALDAALAKAFATANSPTEEAGDAVARAESRPQEKPRSLAALQRHFATYKVTTQPAASREKPVTASTNATIAAQIGTALAPITTAIERLNSRLDSLVQLQAEMAVRLDKFDDNRQSANQLLLSAGKLENLTLGILNCLEHNLKAEFRQSLSAALTNPSLQQRLQQHVQQRADKAFDDILRQVELQQFLQQQLQQAIMTTLSQTADHEPATVYRHTAS